MHSVAELGTTENPGADVCERMYRSMVTTTVADTRIRTEARAGRLRAACYPVHGLEAVCAALGEVLRDGDQLVSTYRNLGDALAIGVPLRAVIAELYGRVDGTSKGKGGPMHLHDEQAGLMATTGIVGSGLPIAVGLALAAQLDGSDRVVVATFGDGATSIGAYHEAINLAALWRLPVLFLCQNNQWGEHTPIAEYTAETDLAKRAASYGVRASAVDGFDAVATWRELGAAVGHARSGAGPAFVEAQTYRLAGHTSTADYSYVPADELAKAMERDPSPTFRAHLSAQGIVDEAALARIDREAQESVEDAFAFAAASPEPDPGELYTDVFADAGWRAGA